MLLILIGMLLMFSFNLFIRYIITFSMEYLSLLFFSLAFIFMIYIKNYTLLDKTLLYIVDPSIIAISLNFYVVNIFRNKKISNIALIINSFIVLNALISVICYIFFKFSFIYFFTSLFISGIIFSGIIIYYFWSEKNDIPFYNITTILIFIFLLLSFIYLIFIMLFNKKAGAIDYIPTIIIILIIEFLYFIEKQELLFRIDKQKNNDSSDLNIRIEKYSFSDREKEIIYLMLSGKTAKEIAYILYLSINTVNWHIQNMYKKASVNNKPDFIKNISQ